MGTRCRPGDLAIIIKDEPGLEMNIGRFVNVHGPRLNDPDQGIMWITTPTTATPLPYIDPSTGVVSTDRRGLVIYHQDDWLLPIRPRRKAHKNPTRTVKPASTSNAEVGLPTSSSQ
ncbi:hypothetical protein GCM10027034_19840 [Ramlibacter solisilvae]|uniref:hypothetical protein n=1 Tax=Ramlibacter tataouinensis TaxID=94132 RepID=UPI0011AE5093|nr:hypothetical protein [Ramlibacter tataouinensis]